MPRKIGLRTVFAAQRADSRIWMPAADQREHEIAADTTVILREWVDLVPSGFSRQPTVGFRMLRPRNTRKTAAEHPIAV